ncbi:MAG: SRPBCC family protein [Planctomycetota bacterium]
MKKVLVVVAAAVLLFVLVGFVLPSDYAVSREAVVPAPRDQVFARVADLETWPDWTAWSRAADEDCKWNYEREPDGRTRSMHWKGPKHGEGRLTFTNVEANARLDFELVFVDGDTELTSHGAFLFADEESGTDVVWSLEGDLGWNPVHHWVGLFMDSMVGRDFDRGLAGLAASFEAK